MPVEFLRGLEVTARGRRRSCRPDRGQRTTIFDATERSSSLEDRMSCTTILKVSILSDHGMLLRFSVR